MADNEAVVGDVGANSIGKTVAEEGESGPPVGGETRSDPNRWRYIGFYERNPHHRKAPLFRYSDPLSLPNP